VFVWLLKEYCFTGMGWDRMAIGMGMGIDCMMRVLDGRRSLACLLGRLGLIDACWRGGFGLVWFLVLLVLALALAV
jgi:hypothetical protein